MQSSDLPYNQQASFLNHKRLTSQFGQFNSQSESLTGEMFFNGEKVHILPPKQKNSRYSESNQTNLVVGQDENTNAVMLMDWGLPMGSYILQLKPLLDTLAGYLIYDQIFKLTNSPFFMKAWIGLSPHPFPDPHTKCWEITVPIQNDYFEPADGTIPIEEAFCKVNNQARQKVMQEMGNHIALGKDERNFATILKNGSNPNHSRGPLRLILNEDYSQYCISLFHDYKEGPDQRCNFFPDQPLIFWTDDRKKVH